MKTSGRNSPCPVCSRVKDADCRFNDEVVLCHTGTDLRPGNTITINGAQWAFIHHRGGFSGSAAVFRPHRELERPSTTTRTPNTAQQLLSMQTRRHQWADAIEQSHAAFQLVWDIPDLYEASPEQLQSASVGI